MILLHYVKDCVLSLLIIVVLSGCRDKPEDQWSAFLDDVLAPAKEKDYQLMAKKLTVYRMAELREFRTRLGEADPAIETLPNRSEPKAEEWHAYILEDVQMFVRSYEDLFDGQPASYSHSVS